MFYVYPYNYHFQCLLFISVYLRFHPKSFSFCLKIYFNIFYRASVLVLNSYRNYMCGSIWLHFLFLKIIYFIDYAISCPISPPLFPSSLHTPSHLHPPHFSSCPWVIHISSLASTFPILFLTSPCLSSTYHLCYLFSAPFPSLSPSI